MTKKIVWGLVVVGLVGILVAGAVVRTAAKTGDGTEAQGFGAGRRIGDGSSAGAGCCPPRREQTNRRADSASATGRAPAKQW